METKNKGIEMNEALASTTSTSHHHHYHRYHRRSRHYHHRPTHRCNPTPALTRKTLLSDPDEAE